MFMFDIETLGTESTTVVLSAACIYFNPEEKPSFEKLIEDSCFVKFSAKDQIQNYNRKVDKSTLEWWDKIHSAIRKTSFDPSPTDLPLLEGISILREYIESKPNWSKSTVWARGSLDQMAIDSLCKCAGQDTLWHYANWRDVRTAVDILSGSSNGYCGVNYEGFNSNDVIKHNPIHDCAYDVMMLLYGESKQ
jgi:hypothetical protein